MIIFKFSFANLNLLGASVNLGLVVRTGLLESLNNLSDGFDEDSLSEDDWSSWNEWSRFDESDSADGSLNVDNLNSEFLEDSLQNNDLLGDLWLLGNWSGWEDMSQINDLISNNVDFLDVFLDCLVELLDNLSFR